MRRDPFHRDPPFTCRAALRLHGLLAIAALTAAGCRRPPSQFATGAAADGVSIAIYRGPSRTMGVVDDRRAVTIDHGELVLERVPVSASLASLTIEPLGGGPLTFTACTRDAIAIDLEASPGAAGDASGSAAESPRRASSSISSSTGRGLDPIATTRTQTLPTIRCRVDARDGRRRVRILYVVNDLVVDVHRRVELTTPDRARVTATYTVTTPARGGVGAVTLYEGSPGSSSPPVQVAAGMAQLDGTVALFSPPPTEVKARLRALFLSSDDSDSQDEPDATASGLYLGRGPGDDSSGSHPMAHPVQVWLELQATLGAGALVAHVELPGQVVRDVDIPRDAVTSDPRRGVTQAPLWLDEHLLITIERTHLTTTARLTRVRTRLTVANTGALPREVEFEQALPASDRRTLEATWPTAPTLGLTGVRAKLAAPAGGLARMRFVVATRMEPAPPAKPILRVE